ncbi:homoserine kinase [Pseudahrensia aquimaris]|uniref:Homoserine kinase n=1 Tax=Pseudahrensia aquimaris TaxID=744461 RepID=A0ABW3FBU9_9HYPH
MAVYTQVSDAQLAAFLGQYDIGRLVSCKGIAEGVENSNFLLQTEQGMFILTLYEKRVAAHDLPFFIGLMDHLAHKGFVCPLPVRMKNGDALGELSGRPAAIVTFLEGMGVKEPSADHCRMAGETLARLHLAGEEFAIRRKNALDPSGWRPLAQNAGARADAVEPGLAALIADEMAFHDAHWPTDLPTGVIHADFFKDNVFFLNDALSGVIDFYFACNDMFAYDLAITVNAWCFDGALRFESDKAKAMIEGYQSVRMLGDAEKLAFGTLCRGAALRFLLTRLNDWLDVPTGALVMPHDPKEFSERLRFFRDNSIDRLMGLV